MSIKVKVSRRQLEQFADRWPCYNGPRRAGWFEFDDNGDLVDMAPHWIKFDGPEMSALADDAKIVPGTLQRGIK